MSQESATPPMGERRRRRERERARERSLGDQQPMSRRERRALEEALATGEVELTPDGHYAPTGEIPVTTSGQHVLPDPDAPPAQAPPAQAPQQPDSPAEQGAATPGEQAEPEREGSPGSAEPNTPEPSTPEPSTPERVTRRSLRQRRTNAPQPPSAPQSAAERTATGRRPVIRPPASARSTRSVDATGELTSVQRAIRDISAVGEQESSATWNVSADPDGSGLRLGESADPPVQGDSPVQGEEAGAAPPAVGMPSPAEPEVVSAESSGDIEAAGTDEPDASEPDASPAAGTDEPDTSEGVGTDEPDTSEGAGADEAELSEEDVDDRFDMQPRWTRIESVTSSAQTPDPEDSAAAESASSGWQDESEEPEEGRHTPRLLQVLYWVVLVLAGVVLGLLVWRMATGDLFGSAEAMALAHQWIPGPAWLQ